MPTPKNGSYWLVGKNYAQADFNSPDSGSDRETIQSAIDAAAASEECKEVYLLGGTYSVGQTPLVPKSGVTLRGAGAGVVRFTCVPESGWAFSNYTGELEDGLEGFVLSDVSIELKNPKSSGVALMNATLCAIKRCSFSSRADGGWHVSIGTQEQDSASSEITSSDNLIRDCRFGEHAGTLEQLLIFNAKRTRVEGCTFTKNTVKQKGPAVCLGLWQWTQDTVVEGCQFYDNVNYCIYYSLTCENTVVRGCCFRNCGTAVYGASVSDLSDYGHSRAHGVTLSGLSIVGGENSESAPAITVGAVDGYFIGGGTSISGYAVGIRLSNLIVTAKEEDTAAVGGVREGARVLGEGGAGSGAKVLYRLSNPINGLISGVRIYNNNAGDVNHEIHPGVLIASVAGEIWQDFYNLTIESCQIYDSRVKKRQTHAISFDGSFAQPITNVSIVSSWLSGQGGASMRVAPGVDVSRVEVIHPIAWSFSGVFPGRLVP